MAQGDAGFAQNPVQPIHLAVVYNDWSLAATGPDGAAVNTTGRSIEICRRQADGTWLFVVDDPFGRG